MDGALLARMRRAAPVALLLLLGSYAAGSSPVAEGVTGRPGGKLVPRSGAYFGTTVDGQAPGPQVELLRPLERRIKRKFEVVQFFYGWDDVFPTRVERVMVRHGRIPMIAWEGTTLSAINSGQYDAMIRARAKALKKWGHWVFMRWGFEMNGEWEPWSGAQNNPNGPRKYRRAYRHIWRIFHDVGARRVVWVWSVNNEDSPRKPWNHWTHYYPGDQYVDWVGLSGFNWGTTKTWSRWRSIDRIIGAVYADYHNRKPIIVTETGTVEQGGSKARWIRHARLTLRRHFPAVGGFLYFNASDDQGATWTVTTSRSAVRAYRRMGHDPYWDRRH